jgi:cobyrinic acid a,c-diamide synthase
MGLFDGVAGGTESGSSAEIAKQLNVPIVLVLDASAAARSLAAVIRGFETFDPGVKVLGVVLNKVGSEGHLRLLKDAIHASCHSRVLGSLPPTPAIQIPERHLGLVTAAELRLSAEQATLLTDLAEQNIDLNFLLDACNFVPATSEGTANWASSRKHSFPTVRVGVPRDPAFCFYYDENLCALQDAGAEIIEFNSLECSRLPAGLDALYFGGGYPELFAERLSSNRSLMDDVRRLASSGRPVYAECGGLIYLSRQLQTIGGNKFAMVGLLPLIIEMTAGLVHFGYAEVTLERDSLLGERGATARGHSFHYSRIVDSGKLEHAYRVFYTLAGRTSSEGFAYANVLASYIHLHFRSNPRLAASLVEHARAARDAMVAHP